MNHNLCVLFTQPWHTDLNGTLSELAAKTRTFLGCFETKTPGQTLPSCLQPNVASDSLCPGAGRA